MPHLPNLLLLETATEICSVGVAKGGELLAEMLAPDRHMHSSHLTLFIQEMMAEAGLAYEDLDGIVLSNGPGSYTSLRVGAATAKGLCFALPNLAFYPVDTLTALARRAAGITEDTTSVRILPTIGSRRDEVYGRFCSKDGQPLDDVRTMVLSEVGFAEKLGERPTLVCGGGTEKIAATLGTLEGVTYRADIEVRAAALLPMGLELSASGASADFADYEPLYLKPPFVTQSRKKLL